MAISRTLPLSVSFVICMFLRSRTRLCDNELCITKPVAPTTRTAMVIAYMNRRLPEVAGIWQLGVDTASSAETEDPGPAGHSCVPSGKLDSETVAAGSTEPLPVMGAIKR